MTELELKAYLLLGFILLSSCAIIATWYTIKHKRREWRWYRRWKGGYWVYYPATGWQSVSKWQHARARQLRHPWAHWPDECGCCEDYVGAKLPTKPQ